MHILSLDRNKSPLQISGKVAGAFARTLETFQGAHILGASRGRLCDSKAFLYILSNAAIRSIGQTKMTNQFFRNKHANKLRKTATKQPLLLEEQNLIQSGSDISSPSGVWGRAPAEIEFCAL